MQVEEFKLTVNVEGLSLLPIGVLIAWDWEWNPTDIDSSEEEEEEETTAEGHFNPHMESEPSDSEEGDHLRLGPIPSVLPTTTHIVTFKCIGTLYEQSRQEALKRAADLIDLGESVQVKLVPEPDNPYDSKAISFQCKVDSKWCLIGYAVREVMDSLHRPIREKKICLVRFAWVKYRVVWLRSGPGFYAGVDIALNGQWPTVVMRHGSTH